MTVWVALWVNVACLLGACVVAWRCETRARRMADMASSWWARAVQLQAERDRCLRELGRWRPQAKTVCAPMYHSPRDYDPGDPE